jgi:hypothetical protein
MTVDRTKYFKIPLWLVAILLPILISGISTAIVYGIQSTQNNVKIEVCQKEIDKLDEKKVDKDVLSMVLEILREIKSSQKEIDKKLEDHMNKK